MPRRVLLALAGCVLFGALGWTPAPPGTPRIGRPPLRSLIADSRLLALERDNGCLDLPAPAPQAWPDWAAAHIAGGDVPPARVVSDPYPTLHSVAVDAVNDRVSQLYRGLEPEARSQSITGSRSQPSRRCHANG